MKEARKFVVSNLLLLMLFCCACLVVQAQDRERHIITAKAGGVNSVSGKVGYLRKGETQWHQLTTRTDLSSGDLVKTEAGGRTEILLNPGSYLRLAENSEFELSDASLDDLSVRMIRGNAIVEATGADGMELLINVVTPQTRIAIVKRGIYRFNILPTQTELLVRKGKALVGDDQATAVKDGKRLSISSGAIEVAKFDKKEQDPFDQWSKQRGETLATANRRIPERAYSNIFNSIWPGDLFQRRFARYGVWYFDPFYNCFTFAPFVTGWGSPYGFGYSGGYWYVPDYNYWRAREFRRINPPSGGGGRGSGGSGQASTGSNVGGINGPRRLPPTNSAGVGSGGSRHKVDPSDLEGNPGGMGRGRSNVDRFPERPRGDGGGRSFPEPSRSYPTSPAPRPAPAPSAPSRKSVSDPGR